MFPRDGCAHVPLSRDQKLYAPLLRTHGLQLRVRLATEAQNERMMSLRHHTWYKKCVCDRRAATAPHERIFIARSNEMSQNATAQLSVFHHRADADEILDDVDAVHAIFSSTVCIMIENGK
jgi:hypothetical protein